DKNNSEYSPDEIELFGFVHQIVEGFKSRTLVNIQDQSRFEKRLLNHLRPACFRVKYRLPSIETLNLDNDKDEQLLVNIIKDLIKPLEQWIGTKFSEDEVKLLTYYFGYLLFDNANSQKISNAKYNAVVVCSNGIIMSNILIKILKNIFPEISFLGTMSSREFSESDHDFNVVFSNMPLKTKLHNYIVKPNMTSTEKTTLRYRVLKDLGLEKVDYQLNALLNLIAKYAKVDNEAKLRNEIISILLSDYEKNDRKGEDAGELPNLLNYIKEKYIKVISSKKTDWKDALYQALEPLIEDNKVEDQYYFELVDQISNRYNYSFLGQDMAIPHAVPEKGIKDDGISLLISHYPIKLPYGKKVRIIAPIAFFHMDRYLNAINQLADLSTNDREINKLLNTNTSEQAFTILKEYVERGE
ncbi:MAG: PTS sugar transporter subunit IIA, partial [Lactobacillus helsingborgensis]|nr:PTS sugar transporter subunit IIA [Lactobacillus helsingborgensis]